MGGGVPKIIKHYNEEENMSNIMWQHQLGYYYPPSSMQANVQDVFVESQKYTPITPEELKGTNPILLLLEDM